MQVLNPLLDYRWDELVACHPRASAFHQRGWLDALRRTYGYEPFVLTTAPPGMPLKDGIVLCRVSSWLTGTRLVSLPFADHCDLLLCDPADYMQFDVWLMTECERRHYRYVELRPLLMVQESHCCMRRGSSYYLHELDLRPSLEQLFRGLHKDSLQRRIRRAERAGLRYERGRSAELFDEFYRLLVVTRRRHQLPPQPRKWFTNLSQCMGNNIEIRVARKDGTPIAAILTLLHRSSVIYKYGCSEKTYHKVGAMPFLFWQLIQESKALGVERIDLGRSDRDNVGLITFKDKFGATKRSLDYYRYPESQSHQRRWQSSTIRRLLSMLPNTAVRTVGRVLYRHMG